MGRDRIPDGDDEFTLPPSTDPSAVRAAKIGEAAHTTLTGDLGFDDIEGGGCYLETADGTRYEVVYPDGWTIDRDGAELRGPGGELGHAGEALAVRGTVATDRSSIRQLGPIFVATDVEIRRG